MTRFALGVRSVACGLLLLGWGPAHAANEDQRSVDELATFIKTLPGRATNDPAARRKIDLIRRVARNDPSTASSAFLIYYNSADSRAGFSHGALWMDGHAYETYPHPKAGENAYRVSSIIDALEHQRSDYGSKDVALPTAMLEIPDVSAAQKTAIRASIMSIKRYSFLNGGGRSAELVNCMGIHYQALRAAGLPLPPLQRWQVLPLNMAKLVARIPGVRVIGNLRGWLSAGRLPHFGRTTLHALRRLSGDAITRVRKRRSLQRSSTKASRCSSER